MTVESLKSAVGLAIFADAVRDAMRTCHGGRVWDTSPALDTVDEQIRQADWDSVSDWDFVRFIRDLYLVMPTYRLLYWMWITRDFGEYSDEVKTSYWNLMHRALSAENSALAGPAAYHLWSEVFEGDFAADAWSAILIDLSPKLVTRMLQISGPVPFPLKEQLYFKLMHDGRWHHDIFVSLIASDLDAQGKIDRASALNILSKLRMNAKDEEARRVFELRLKEPKSHDERWTLQMLKGFNRGDLFCNSVQIL